MLRILLISPHFPPNPFTCGVGDYSRHVVDQLRRRGHSVDVLASETFSGQRTSQSGPTVITVPSSWGLRAGLKLVNLAVQKRYDVINLQSTVTLYRRPFRLLLIVVNLFTPVIVSFHTLFGRSILSRFDFLYQIAVCRGFISTNEEVTHVLSKLPWYKNRVREIPIASNIVPSPGILEKRASLRAALHVPPGTCVVSNFGLFYPGKGLTTLLNSCAVLRERNFPFFLMLLGALREEDSHYIGKIKTLVRTLHLEPHVKFYGELDSEGTSVRLAASDIYVVPYDRGASIRRGTLWAGLSHNLPVVTTRPAVVSKYITDKNVALVPPKDPPALADAIVNLHADAARRADLVSNARALCERLSWENIAVQIEEEFSRQLGGKR